ncbi:hypothetical protein Tco_0603678 [Tanacetum coccineum]
MQKHFTRGIPNTALSEIKSSLKGSLLDLLSLSIFYSRSFSSDREIQRCNVHRVQSSVKVQEKDDEQAERIVSEEERLIRESWTQNPITTRKSYVPVKRQVNLRIPEERLIPKGHRFSHKKTTTVLEKTRTPRSCLRWQPTGRILKTVVLETSARMVSQKMSYIKWCLLKITLQAPFLNVKKTFDRSRSSLGLHGNDVCSHQFRPRSSSNDF